MSDPLVPGSGSFTPPRTPDTWIGRLKQADQDAEQYWSEIHPEDGLTDKYDCQASIARSLIAIAAELRASRLARRPGAGQ